MALTNLSKSTEFRITALWALSESTLGGFLHAFRIPFTGLFVGGFSVLFICLLASLGGDKKKILTSMLIVMLIKFSISPHTPLTAYFAVTLQGLLGYFLFSFIKNHKVAAITLGISTQLLSAFQRLITITLVFGMGLWDAIDNFSNSIIAKFYSSADLNGNFSVSLLLIIIYGIIHIGGGIFFGRLGYLLPNQLSMKLPPEIINEIKLIEYETKSRIKKKWYRRKMPQLLFVLLISSAIFTYVFPVAEEELFIKVIYIAIRAIFVVSIWILVISPLIMKGVQKFFAKKSGEYKKSIDTIINVLPFMKRVIIYAYRESKKYPGYWTRVKNFITLSLSIAITIEIDTD